MTLAWRLAQAGRRVTVLESAPELGGLAAAWRIGDIVWDRHYHVTLLSDSHLLALLAELGLSSEMRWRAARTAFFTGGRLHSLSSAWEYLRFPPLNFIDKVRLAATILHASRIRDWRRLERISAADWLRRWSGRRTLEKIWLPLLRAKLGESYRDTSAAFIWTSIARLYAARRAGLKQELFGYVSGGYARILETFTRRLLDAGVTLRTSSEVESIERGQGGGLSVRLRGGERLDFDSVVATVPAPVAARISPELTAEERRRLESIRYLGIICASILSRRPLAGYYITNITDPPAPFTGVIEGSALVDKEELGGHSLIYLPKYVEPGDPLTLAADEDIERVFLDALGRMYPQFRRDDVAAFKISRVRHVFALPTVGYSALLPPRRTSVPGLYLVNSAQILNGTSNVDEVVRLAGEAAADLVAAPAPQPREVSA